MARAWVLLHDGLLFVTDNQTSRVLAFDLDGELIDWVDTGLPEGSLMGITADSGGRLLVGDAVGDRVLRVSPKN